MNDGFIGKGYIQIYTGNGKGKTTAALGLALRGAGHGLKSVIVQFMKGWIDYGELKGVTMLAPYVELHQCGRDTFVNPSDPDPEDIELAEKGMALAEEVLWKRKADIVILDEIICTVSFKLIEEDRVITLMERKPDGMEMILTGRGATARMIEMADLVTEMKDIKHYYGDGVDARIGIER